MSKPRLSRLRIIGGRWRRRHLSFPDTGTVRPTPDRVRETLFNWLAPVIEGARCLDLFAGSGALGMEALSRGAASAVFVEQDPRLTRALRDNLARLGAEDARVMQAEALTWLQGIPTPFDVVLLDPPFHQGLLAPVCQRLATGGWLGEGALVYLELARAETPTLPATWELRREKTAGEVYFRLFRSDPAG